eukprot:TRINITY_DN403_c0_g1_i7.p1 TRINITY_DN403_c0_g1~~TRINITY_DN403_c0_g1_i7.p1  ORF type:complete len:386 (+),score=105.41 TRINITY_DN403_c0_g1_i7:843-2000(+)
MKKPFFSKWFVAALFEMAGVRIPLGPGITDEIRPAREERVTLLEGEQLDESNATREEEDEDMDYHAETVLTILKPVALTMIFVVWAVKTIAGGTTDNVQATIAFSEKSDDGGGAVLWKSIANAAIVLAAIFLTTVIFVILYKYRCLKIIYGWLMTSSTVLLGLFGAGLFYALLEAWNVAMDDITFVFLMWNFAIVGVVAIFWHAPTRINQGYLILISGLLAIFFTKLPEWTTLAILVIIALWDLFAVLAPCGPLKMLVETAQQRQEPIPALLYNASVFVMMANPNEEPEEPEPNPKRKGVKLGLGDFIFYSVLIGRAALFDMITVFTSFIGVITGLFLTLLLLAILRKALPALPISIALGITFYLVTSYVLFPFTITLGSQGIFV